MKLIYEKAKTVYAWLGGDGFEDVVKGMQSVQALYAARSEDTLSDTTLLSVCTGFLQICSCPYWQRRWIIQELTTACTAEVICQSHIVSLDALIWVYSKLYYSRFWLSAYTATSTPFGQICEFRRRYHNAEIISLCEAIPRTKSYMSKDHRDRIFALIGICSDGTTLVPTPNYSQSPEEVSRDLTRAVLLQNRRLDVIFLASRMRKERKLSISIPTWTLDWCSENLSADVYQSKQSIPLLPGSLAASISRAHGNVLRIQGVTCGTVVSLSSCLNWTDPIRPQTHIETNIPLPSRQSSTQYYGSKNGIAHALVESVLFHGMERKINEFHVRGRRTNLLRTSMLNCKTLRFKIKRDAGNCFHDPPLAFSKWVSANENFKIDGLPISYYFGRRYLPKRFLVLLIISLIFANIGWAFRKLPNPFRNPLDPTIFGTFIAWVASTGILSYLTLVYLLYLGEHFLLPFKDEKYKRRLVTRINQSQYLFLLDNGIIGFAQSDIRVGDEICLLAGYKRFAVLRKHSGQSSAQYHIVGSCEAYLNSADRKKYSTLLVQSNKHYLSTITACLPLLQAQAWWKIYELA